MLLRYIIEANSLPSLRQTLAIFGRVPSWQDPNNTST